MMQQKQPTTMPEMTRAQLIELIPSRWTGILPQALLSNDIIMKAISAFTAKELAVTFAAKINQNSNYVSKLGYVLRLEGLVPVSGVASSNHPINQGYIAQKAAFARERVAYRYPAIKKEFKENAAVLDAITGKLEREGCSGFYFYNKRFFGYLALLLRDSEPMEKVVKISKLSKDTLEFRARYLYNIGFMAANPYVRPAPFAVLMRSKDPEELKKKIFHGYPEAQTAYERIVSDPRMSEPLETLYKRYPTQLNDANRKMYLLLILAMWNSGSDAVTINTATGISTTTIYRWMDAAREAGVTYAVSKRSGRSLDTGGMGKIRRYSQLIKNGVPPEQAAKDPHVDIDSELAARWLRILRPFAPLHEAPSKAETKE